MATVTVIGASGKTGRRVVERALAVGHDVRALVRDPAKLPLTHERLTVITGDVTSPESVDLAVEGSDAVLSLFGHVKGSPPTIQTDGTRVIVDSMRRHGVRRLVTLSGGGLRAEQDKPKFADHLMRGLMKVAARNVLSDAESHLAVLRESDLDWTVVRGPRLTEQPGTGSYRVGWVGVDSGMDISRDDLADFIVTQIDDTKYIHHLPFVTR